MASLPAAPMPKERVLVRGPVEVQGLEGNKQVPRFAGGTAEHGDAGDGGLSVLGGIGLGWSRWMVSGMGLGVRAEC